MDFLFSTAAILIFSPFTVLCRGPVDLRAAKSPRCSTAGRSETYEKMSEMMMMMLTMVLMIMVADRRPAIGHLYSLGLPYLVARVAPVNVAMRCCHRHHYHYL